MNPSCIDLILPSSLKDFQNSNAFNTELSDFCKMVVTVMKARCKVEPKIVSYKKSKDFSNNRFREVLTNELSEITVNKINEGYETFFGICSEVSNSPSWNENIRGNNTPFMNKNLGKEITKRLILRQKFQSKLIKANPNQNN